MNKLRFVCQEYQQLQNIHILYSYPTVQYSMYCIMYYIELYNEHCLVQYECHLEGIACMFVLLLCRRCIEYLHFAMQVHSKIQQSSCKYSQVLYRYVERFFAQFLQSCIIRSKERICTSKHLHLHNRCVPKSNILNTYPDIRKWGLQRRHICTLGLTSMYTLYSNAEVYLSLADSEHQNNL